MLLSPVSILAVTVLSGLMSMAVLGSLRSAAIPGVTYWIGANAISIVSFVLFAMQGHAPRGITILCANGLLAYAVLLVLHGCRLFFGRRRAWWPEYAALGATMLAIAYWTYDTPDIYVRIAAVSAFHAYIYMAVGWQALRARPPQRPKYAYRFVTIVAFLGGAGHAVRGLTYGFGLVQQHTLLESTPLNIAFLGLGILMLPCMSIGMVMLAHDRMAEQLERLANVDELTGAVARRAFLAQAHAMAKSRKGTKGRLFMAIVDIDHFKAINDKHGHASGDLVLAHFASVVADNLRPCDLFGRLGGEEFAVFFTADEGEAAAGMIDRLRVGVSASRCKVADAELSCTFSAGIDEYRDGEPLADLLARADNALYAAKSQGRNRVVPAWSLDLETEGAEPL
ncbi:GGDEF domain-containing protein [Trinickia violacea]|uniref:diguanylate cyclase n=1 Tax=Trinickia violacea TaxID=2571746 RepID=A0A4P8ITF9_9BURK|nr:GGDEF domain-containing protein [Trinickia violacea]QCP52402.1 GGDEF domain-containing protein [Trinickia violacea]